MRKYIHDTGTKATDKKTFDFETLYQHTHDELTLQQSKRDQIITVYLAIISFVIPFVLSLSSVTEIVKGLLFLSLAVIGFLFGIIVIRYRIYKECYWLGCQALTQLTNYDADKIDKTLIQHYFYNALYKKYHKYVDFDRQKIHWFTLFRRSFFSAETLYFTVLSFVVTIIAVLGVIYLAGTGILGICLSIATGLLVLVALHFLYIKNLCKVFATLKYHNAFGENVDRIANNLFNSTFSKSWTLHFYLDENN